MSNIFEKNNSIFQSLLDAHDDIIDRNFDPEPPIQKNQQMFQSQSSFMDLSDNIRLVGIMKSEEPLVSIRLVNAIGSRFLEVRGHWPLRWG